jgi:hypothetical protein
MVDGVRADDVDADDDQDHFDDDPKQKRWYTYCSVVIEITILS